MDGDPIFPVRGFFEGHPPSLGYGVMNRPPLQPTHAFLSDLCIGFIRAIRGSIPWQKSAPLITRRAVSHLRGSEARSEYRKAIPEYLGASFEYTETSLRRLGASSKYTETISEYLEAASEYSEVSSKYWEASSEYLEVSSEYTEIISEYLEASSQYMETVSEYSEASPEYTEAAREYLESSSEYLGAISQQTETARHISAAAKLRSADSPPARPSGRLCTCGLKGLMGAWSDQAKIMIV
ncbi:MAG: hypothetical protein QOI04_258 [Verrucomicrobiota bacterium]